MTTGNLITFLELCYPKTYQNASVKCHSVNETWNFVDIFREKPSETEGYRGEVIDPLSARM